MTKTKKPFTALEIKDALARKHKDDVFFTEVPTGFTGDVIMDGKRLDAWSLEPSFYNPVSTGYEVKVSRTDFTNDHKFPSYAGVCNELYLVAPEGVVRSLDELPDFVGMYEARRHRDGIRLFTIRKATFREVVIPSDFYRALIVNRYREHTLSPNRLNADTAQDWLDGKRAFFTIGSSVAYQLSKIKHDCKEEIEKVKKADAIEEFISEEFGLVSPFDRDIDDLKEKIHMRTADTDIRMRIGDVLESVDGLEERLHKTSVMLTDILEKSKPDK